MGDNGFNLEHAKFEIFVRPLRRDVVQTTEQRNLNSGEVSKLEMEILDSVADGWYKGCGFEVESVKVIEKRSEDEALGHTSFKMVEDKIEPERMLRSDWEETTRRLVPECSEASFSGRRARSPQSLLGTVTMPAAKTRSKS